MSLRRFAITSLLSIISGCCVALVGPLCVPGGLPQAHAAVSLEVSLSSLAKRATRILVGVPTESRSLWEQADEGGRRIVTYHRIRISKLVAGAASQDVWVRTLGGHVDEIGQRVEGAAVLPVDKPVLLFLTERADGTHSVLEMAQGAYPVVHKDGEEQRIEAPIAPGVLIPRRAGASAHSLLVGRRLGDAIRVIMAARASNEK